MDMFSLILVMHVCFTIFSVCVMSVFVNLLNTTHTYASTYFPSYGMQKRFYLQPLFLVEYC